MMNATRSLLVALALIAWAAPVSAATFTAADCNVGSVQTAINSAANGDTVIIPNGSCSWESGISTAKQIVIRGASVGGVTITHTAGAGTLLTMTIGSAFHSEIANLRFQPGTGSGRYFSINGTGLVPFLHDCYFNIPDFQLLPSEWFVTGGVIWNVTVESLTINGTSGSNGSGSTWLTNKITTPWIAASTMGALDTAGTQNLYIEDSTFIDLYNSAYDGDDNARLVVRHSTIRNTQMITHGTTSLQGGRHVELYDNAYQYRTHAANASGNTSVNLNRYFWLRAGTMVFTGNSVENITSTDWGNRDELVFIVESATRSGSGSGCCTSYMCIHQPGAGGNGSVQIADPVYIWNNTGTYVVGLNNQDPPLQNCFGHDTAEFFVLNRDYFLDTTSNPNNGAKPGWSRYTYPHPLIGGTYTTVFQDNFDRVGNPTLGPNWTDLDAGWDIASFRARTSNTVNFAKYTNGSLGADQYAQCTLIDIANAGADSGPGPAVRIGASDGYFAQASTEDTTLYKRKNGAYQRLGRYSFGAAPGDRIRLEVVQVGGQARLTVLKDTGSGFVTIIGPIDDPDLTSGSPGLWGVPGGVIVDDWEAGDLAVGPRP